MIRRAFLPVLLALALVLGSLTAVVAQTRMAMAGGYCGIGTPELLLDSAGVPLLDGEGEAITAPECPACHLSLAATASPRPLVLPFRAPFRAAEPVSAPPRGPFRMLQGGHARAPPRAA
jgi:hypothetical protein